MSSQNVQSIHLMSLPEILPLQPELRLFWREKDMAATNGSVWPVLDGKSCSNIMVRGENDIKVKEATPTIPPLPCFF